MSDIKTVFIVVPVYNDAGTIASVIHSLQDQLFQNLIVVDDGSVEAVFSAVEKLRVHYLRHAINLGQGAALQTGFSYALKRGAGVIVTFDADGQHDAADVKKLIAPILENRCDVVLGSRFLSGQTVQMPFGRKLVLQAARIVNFFVSGLWLTDAHNGLRAFSSAALQKIHLEHNRMSHASEIVAALRKNRLRITEVPVTVRYTDYAKRKGQRNRDGISIIFDLFLYKFFK